MMPYTTRFHIIKRPFQSSTNESLDSLSKYIIRFIIRFNRSQYIFKNTFFIHILNIYSNSLSQCVPMGVSRRFLPQSFSFSGALFCFAANFFFLPIMYSIFLLTFCCGFFSFPVIFFFCHDISLFRRLSYIGSSRSLY